MVATNILDGHNRKAQMLAMGGIELQSVFYGKPGADIDGLDGSDPYQRAKEKLTDHFSPKQHESFERYQFWSMIPGNDEPIEKFMLRVQQRAEKCSFGQTELECRQIAIIDKVIQNAPEDLRRKLLEKDHLTLDDTTKIVNAYQSVKYQAEQMKSKSSHQIEINRLVTRRPNVPLYRDSWLPAYKNKCDRCGRLKYRGTEQCPAIDKVCHRCHKSGHLQVVCKSNQPTHSRYSKRRFVSSGDSRPGLFPKRSRNVMNINTPESVTETTENFPVYKINDDNDELVRCSVGGVSIDMLVDSGSTYNLIDDTTWALMKLKGAKIHSERYDNAKRFLAHGRVPLDLLTVFDATLEVTDGSEIISTETTFFVIRGGQQALLGKVTDCQLGLLRVGLPSVIREGVNQINTDKQFPKIKDFKLMLPIDRSIPPVIQPLRRCPIPILEKVKEKLDELLQMEIIEKVTKPSSWVSPLVLIMKDGGEPRLCLDMRRANQAVQRLNHPLPVFEDLLPRFNGAKFFITLDIKQAFHQVELAEESRDITTFITNWGLFRYTRLLFGINYAPEFFQHLMESILAGCPNTVVFIDDIMGGETEKEHDNAVKTTLSVLSSHGIELNVHKCKFKQLEVMFLGHRLTENGVLPSDDKIKSILSFRPPRSKEELRSFLGLVTYVSHFIPDLATVSSPLRELLKNSTVFQWGFNHEQSFQSLKNRIGSVHHLGYYDPKDRTVLITDASGAGLGAVLVQYKGDVPRVISYASRSLSDTEKRYPPIELEALAIVWAVERFKVYLLGISFILETDHRPLEVLFTFYSQISSYCTNRTMDT
ncbi:uncharacterized protein K02A2.6-like [Toxorhynchites rutilus septentrionalis]|uniref:uncharacterized protein K02A2.6-like n=1 Tax=Toxorhynchites rutilus septentrionalis TaxID=329112 RepID=UPI00247A2650|nr:uncharacterized protein K02A2.6-like [Toxorhynchites rutilus septentrionalis]